MRSMLTGVTSRSDPMESKWYIFLNLIMATSYRIMEQYHPAYYHASMALKWLIDLENEGWAFDSGDWLWLADTTRTMEKGTFARMSTHE